MAIGEQTILVTLAHKVQGLATFSSAVDKVLQAQQQLSRTNRDYSVELQKVGAQLNQSQVRLQAQRQALYNSNVALNTYATRLAQAQSRLARMDAAHGSHAALLGRIANLENRLATATAQGNARSVNALTNLVNMLRRVEEQYRALPGQIQRLDAAQSKQQTRSAQLSAGIQVTIARIRQLASALTDLGRKQAVAGQPAPGSTTGFWTNIAQAVGLFQKAISGSTRAVSQGVQQNRSFSLSLTAIGNVTNIVSNALSSFGRIIEYTIGNLLAGAIRQGIRYATDLGRTVLETVRNFERLTLSIRAMAAQELRAADSTLSMDESLYRAAGTASEILEWMERLAIISPFSIEDVKQSYLFAQALGFTVTQSVRVTQAVTDWASATGRSGEAIERVVYALGQIRTAGRLVGQDMLQLAQAGIGVDQILAKAFNKSTAEIREMRIAGLIPANEALEIIIKTLEEDWAGAAKDQARSIAGLMNSLGDLANFLSRDLFGPIDAASGKVGGALGVVREHMGDLVDFLSSGAVRNAVKAWGRQLGQMADNAFTWGRNLIVSFANGIYDAAVDVVRALTSIGKWVTFFLEAHSPPRLLPYIDEWGRSALQAWLSGFNDLRADAFSKLEDKMESFLRSLSIDVLPEVDLVPTILGIREALGQALAGEISISDVIGSLGMAGAPMTGYVEALFNLLNANQEVEAAQKRLNDITEHYDGLLKSIEADLQRIENAQSDLLDEQRIRMLQLVQQDPNATLNEKELARLEIERINTAKRLRMTEAEAEAATSAAEEELDAAKEKQDAAESAFKLQELIINSQIKTNELLQEQLALLERLSKVPKEAAAGAGEELAPAGIDIGGASFEDAIKQTSHDISKPGRLQLALLELKRIWAETWASMMTALAPLLGPLNTLKTSFTNLVDAVKDSFPDAERVVGETIAGIVSQIASFGPGTLNNLSKTLDLIAKLWRDHGDTVMEAIGKLVVLMVGAFFALVQVVTALILGLTFVITSILTVWAIVTEEGWSGLWSRVGAILATVMTAIVIKIRTKLAEANAYWIEKLNAIKTKWNTIWDDIKTKVEELIPLVVSYVKEKIESIKTWIGEQVPLWVTAGENLINGIKDGVVAAALGLAGAVVGAIGDALKAGMEFLGIQSPSKVAAKMIGKPLGAGIASGLLDSTGMIQGAMGTVLGRAVYPAAAGAMGGGGSSNSSVVYNYNYSPTYSGAPASPQQDFTVMRVWSR